MDSELAMSTSTYSLNSSEFGIIHDSEQNSDGDDEVGICAFISSSSDEIGPEFDGHQKIVDNVKQTPVVVHCAEKGVQTDFECRNALSSDDRAAYQKEIEKLQYFDQFQRKSYNAVRDEKDTLEKSHEKCAGTKADLLNRIESDKMLIEQMKQQLEEKASFPKLILLAALCCFLVAVMIKLFRRS